MTDESQNKNSGDVKIRELCDSFQDRWSRGDPVPVESFLDDFLGDEIPPADLVVRLIQQEFELRRQKGESPILAEYQNRFANIDLDLLKDLLLLPAPPPLELDGPLLPTRYRPIKEIGRGGIGSVWLVHDKTLDRPLAAKVLHDRYRADRAANMRLDREALLTGGLQHPGIPPIHDRGQLISGSSYFIMKLVDGETLAEILKRPGSLEQRSYLLGIFEQITQTMAFAHSKGIIHRDLKPSNIMVGEFAEVQIMDWGMAKSLVRDQPRPSSSSKGERHDKVIPEPVAPETVYQSNDSSFANPMRTLTRQGDVFGTPSYMPPEQARGELDEMSERADVFSLGGILLEILTGKPLYDEVPLDQLISSAAAGDVAASLNRLDSHDVDQELIQLCQDCLGVDPAGRPQDAQLVAERISGYLQSVERRLREAELSRSKAELKVVEERKRKRLAVALVVTLLFAVAIGVIGAVMFQQERERQRIARERERAGTLVEAIGAAPVEAVPIAVESLRPVKGYAVESLLQQIEEHAEDNDRKLRFSIALAHFGNVDHQYLVQQLGDVPPTEMSTVVCALANDEANSVSWVRQAFERQTTSESKARFAWSAAYLGDDSVLNEWLADPKNAEGRGALIEVCATWQGEIGPLMKTGFDDSNSLVRYALFSGIAEIPFPQIADSEIKEWSPKLFDLCKSTAFANLRSVAELILRRWQCETPKYEPESTPGPQANWYVNSAEMVMVQVSDFPRAQKGSGGYQFFISDREVSAQQFRLFVKEDQAAANRTVKKTDALNKSSLGRSYLEVVESNIRRNKIADDESVTPIRNIGYYCALRFCNWLSRREGLEPYYVDQSTAEIKNSIGSNFRLENWIKNPQANGYRLPDYWEFRKALKPFEFVGFISTSTKYHQYYAWYLKNTQDPQPIATRLPNALGLFDLAGNLSEMTDFTSTHDHRHTLLGGSYRVKDIRDLGTGAKGSGAIFYAPEVGFRVVRLEKTEAHKKHMNQLSASIGEWKVRSPTFHQPSSYLKAIQSLSKIGLELLDHGEYVRAKHAFDFSRQLATKLIESKTAVEKARVFRAVDSINGAIICYEQGQLESASRLLKSARSDLNLARPKNFRNESAQRTLMKRVEVESRVNLDRAFEMATHWDSSKRKTRSAYFMALQAIEFLGEDDGQNLAKFAATIAADGDFEKAIRYQEKAISLLDQSDQSRAEQQSRLKLYQQSTPYIRPR